MNDLPMYLVRGRVTISGEGPLYIGELRLIPELLAARLNRWHPGLLQGPLDPDDVDDPRRATALDLPLDWTPPPS